MKGDKHHNFPLLKAHIYTLYRPLSINTLPSLLLSLLDRCVIRYLGLQIAYLIMQLPRILQLAP